MSRSGWPRIASGRTSVAGDHDGPRRHGSSLCAACMSPRTAHAQLDPSTVGALPCAATPSPRPGRGGGLRSSRGGTAAPATSWATPSSYWAYSVVQPRPAHPQGSPRGWPMGPQPGAHACGARPRHPPRCLGDPSAPEAAAGSRAGQSCWGAGPAPAAPGDPRHSTTPQWWADHAS